MFITPWEVVKYSPLGPAFPVDKISGQIAISERDLIDFYGVDFFEILREDLVVDSDTYTEYKPGVTYPANSPVIFLGVRYKSTASVNALPGTSVLWVRYKIFTTTEYNNLWANYLRPYLAYDIALPSLTFATYNAESNGLMTHNDNGVGMSTVDPGSFSLYKTQIQIQRDRMKKHMHDYINSQHKKYNDKTDDLYDATGGPYKEVSFIDSSVCGSDSDFAKPAQRHIFWD